MAIKERNADPVDEDSTGLVQLFSDMVFERQPPGEITCPSCGEKVTLVQGRCPTCHELIFGPEQNESGNKVKPILSGGRVIFVHLDVECGRLDYLDLGEGSAKRGQAVLDLDELDPKVIDGDWEEVFDQELR